MQIVTSWARAVILLGLSALLVVIAFQVTLELLDSISLRWNSDSLISGLGFFHVSLIYNTYYLFTLVAPQRSINVFVPRITFRIFQDFSKFEI